MINIDNLQKYFEPIIEADLNPFQLISQTTFKENGTLQHQTIEETITLEELQTDLIQSIIDKSQHQVVKFYATNFIQKLFNSNKKKNLLKILQNIGPEEFLFMSQSTFDRLLDRGVYIIPIIDEIGEDIIIIATRDRLVYRHTEKIEINYNPDCFKVIKLS
jgi:hypothetical protein